ncbi:MAG: hypothetical protein QOI34_331 [Verrucomicrobiota bacterium]|jgi:hypothetical protein
MANRAADSARVKKPPSAGSQTTRVPKNALIAMAVIVVAMALLSIHANVQRFRRAKTDTIVITPAALPSASSSPSPDR